MRRPSATAARSYATSADSAGKQLQRPAKGRALLCFVIGCVIFVLFFDSCYLPYDVVYAFFSCGCVFGIRSGICKESQGRKSFGSLGVGSRNVGGSRGGTDFLLVLYGRRNAVSGVRFCRGRNPGLRCRIRLSMSTMLLAMKRNTRKPKYSWGTRSPIHTTHLAARRMVLPRHVPVKRRNSRQLRLSRAADQSDFAPGISDWSDCDRFFMNADGFRNVHFFVNDGDRCIRVAPLLPTCSACMRTWALPTDGIVFENTD